MHCQYVSKPMTTNSHMAGNHVSHQLALVKQDLVSKTDSETQARLFTCRWDTEIPTFYLVPVLHFDGHTSTQCGNWPAAGKYSSVDSSVVSRQAKTSHGAIRNQRHHRQETGQFSFSRVWVSANFSTVHTEKISSSWYCLVCVQAYISLKCAQVAHDRGTSSRILPARLAANICSKLQLRLQSYWVDAGNNVGAQNQAEKQPVLTSVNIVPCGQRRTEWCFERRIFFKWEVKKPPIL